MWRAHVFGRRLGLAAIVSVGTVVATPSGRALANGTTYLKIMDNGGLQVDGRFVQSLDLRVALDSWDEWSSTIVSVEVFDASRVIYPPDANEPTDFSPVVPEDEDLDGQPDPIVPADYWRTQASSPHDFPNVIEIGSPNSTLGIPLPGLQYDPHAIQNLGYFDTSNDEGLDLVLFRLALASDEADAPALTLAPVGDPVARIHGTNGYKSRHDIYPFDLMVYEVPEPSSMALMAMLGPLGLMRRRAARLPDWRQIADKSASDKRIGNQESGTSQA